MAIRRSRSSYKHFNSDTYSSTYRSTTKLNKNGDVLIETGGESGNNGQGRQTTIDTVINGQFVSSIALIVMLFMILILVAGSLKHEPMEMVVGVAQRVSNYGEGFKGDLTKFSGAIDSIKRDENQTYTIYFQGHYVEIPKWFTQGLNGAIDIFKFLTAVPVAFTSLALRFLWMFVDVIGFCIL